MQTNDGVFGEVWRMPEITNLIMRNVPVSREGAVALQNFRGTNRQHAVAGASMFREDVWIKHQEGMQFVKRMELYDVENLFPLSWWLVRGALDNYKKCEYVIMQIMLSLRGTESIQNGQNVDYFHHQDTTLNIRIVCDILAEYPLNSLIQEMACVFLRGIYEYGIQCERFHESYTCAQCIHLAVYVLRAPNRTIWSVHNGMQLLLTLQKVDKNALQQFINAVRSPG